ncbi:MAG: glycosyltransferase family 39 protein [bacterium]|nr:glycosyltransferase family 39 protein [bacterium]
MQTTKESFLSDKWLWSLILLAAIIRLDFLIASNWVIDSDEAIVGLMAKHILEGKEIPIFYYGQAYMGSLEAILTSFVFYFTGISSFALKIVPFIFSLVLVLQIYLITSQLGSTMAARVAALLCAVPPSALVVWSTMSRGGFIEILVIGATTILLSLKWIKEEKPRFSQTFIIWFLFGLGWWVNNQIIFFIVSISLCVLLRSKKLISQNGFFWIFKHLAVSIFAGILGSLPFWIYNFQHKFESFNMLNAAGSKSNILEHLNGFFVSAVPILLGAKRFWQETDFVPGGTIVASFIFGILLITLITWRAKSISGLFRFKIDSKNPVELLIIFIIVTSLIFVISSFGHLVSAPRYLLPLYVAIFPLIALTLAEIYKSRPKSALVLLGLILSLNLLSSYLGGRSLQGQPFVAFNQRASKDHTDLIKWLDQNNYNLVRTNYWIGYRLAFETNERVIFSVFREPWQIRIPAYEEKAKNFGLEDVPYVLVPKQAEIIEQALTQLRYAFRKTLLSDYVVFDKIESLNPKSKKLDSELFTVSSSDHSKDAKNGVDGDLNTRWGTGSRQVPGMTFNVIFKTPQVVSGFMYDLGNWYSDYPRGLRIDGKDTLGVLHTLLEADAQKDLAYLMDSTKFMGAFEPIKLKELIFTQTGEDPIFDWSLAELSIFTPVKVGTEPIFP